MTTTKHQLDYEDKYPLQLDYDRERNELRVQLDHQKSAPWRRFVENLTNHIQLFDNTAPFEPGIPQSGNRVHRQRKQDTLIFKDLPSDFNLAIGDQTIGSYHVNAKGELELSYYRKATSSEMRRMGTFHKAELYEQNPDDAELIEHAKKAVFTDFHTHSSGHISPEGLIKIALKHDAYYPESLLEEAGIAIDYQRFRKADDKGNKLRDKIDRIKFPPRETPGMPDKVEAIKLSALTPEELHKLKMRMEMPGEKQATYSKMENDAYRFRYPFTKQPSLMPDILKQTARELKDHGIKYAEIFYVGLDQPDLLATLHRTMHEIENDPQFAGITMRFQLGIPRGFTDEQIETTLEKAKVVTQSPYIVGVNLLGHEVTKTKKFANIVHSFCAWAEKNRPGLMIDAHAGENAKNPGNVEELLDLGQEFKSLNFGIGHGVYGLTKSAIAKAAKLCEDPEHPRLRIESNPDSVLALNNIDHHMEIPYNPMVKANIPFVIGSDSAGTYGTYAEQLGLAAYYGGLREDGFAKLKEHQERLMRNQMAYSDRLAAKIPEWHTLEGKMAFVEKMKAELAEIVPVEPKIKAPKRTPEEIREEVRDVLAQQEVQLLSKPIDETPGLAGLAPITVVGAGGESWAKVNPDAQREVATAIDMLAHVIDPNKAYFFQGRSKKIGLSYVANTAIQHANNEWIEKGEKPFHSVGVIVDEKFPLQDSYGHLTHLLWEKKKHLDIAEVITKHTEKANGVMLAAGGLAFTRDIILEADQNEKLNKNLMLFENAEGASADKAKVLNPDYRVQTGKDVVKKLFATRPELFRSDFDLAKLDALYQQSTQRVEEYGYEAPLATKGQTIEGDESPQKERKLGG